MPADQALAARHARPSLPDYAQPSLVASALAPLTLPAPSRPALGLALLCRYALAPPHPLLSRLTVPCPSLAPSLDGLPYRGTSDGVAVYSNLEPVGTPGE